MAMPRRFCLILVAATLFALAAKAETVIVFENGQTDTVFSDHNGPFTGIQPRDAQGYSNNGANCPQELPFSTFILTCSDPFGSGTTADGRFEFRLEGVYANAFGGAASAGLIATVTDLAGGPGSIKIEATELYHLAFNFSRLNASGSLAGDCTAGGGSQIASSMLVNIDGPAPLALPCPSPQTTIGPVPFVARPLIDFDRLAVLTTDTYFNFGAGAAAGSTESVPVTVSFSAAPEPATWLFAASGLLGLGLIGPRKSINNSLLAHFSQGPGPTRLVAKG
jgi:hypothetical protein